MDVEERGIGMPLTPEVRALVRTVFERSFERAGGRVDRVRVRLMADGDGVRCRARLWPEAGATVVITETRPSTFEAVLASASGLVRALRQRHLARGRRSRRPGGTPACA